jgi:hypothetical protein
MATSVTGKEAGALERVATAIDSHASALEANKRSAVQEVNSTTWLGVAATSAKAVAADLEAALDAHIRKMRECAEHVRTASAGHEAADADAGDALRRSASQLGQLPL